VYEWRSSDHGFFGETIPIRQAVTNAIMGTAGRVEGGRIKLPLAASVTNIVYGVVTGGATLTAGQCFASLHTSAGVLIAQSVDQAANMAGTGLINATLAGGPFALSAGEYYAVLWFNGTTGPTLARASASNATFPNANRSSPNLLTFTANTSITTTAPGTLAAQNAITNVWWLGLS
jgi:hypothetical protein